MKNINYEKCKEGINIIDNNVSIITNHKEINNMTSSWNATIVIRDAVRKDNENDIRQCIKLLIEVMDDGYIKIPSTIKVQTWILNNHENKNSLNISLVGDSILISYSNSIGKNIKINIHDCMAQDIIEHIETYLNSFEGLRVDEDFNKALETICPSLKETIEEILNLWNTIDIDSYIEQQKELIKIYELEYLEKVNPIKRHIKSLEMINKNVKGK